MEEKMNRRTAEQGTAEYRSKKHFPGTKSQDVRCQVSELIDLKPGH
jgi:hypothetical protein